MSWETQERLPSAVYAGAAILQRGSESVRAVLAGEDNRFSRALADLQRLSVGGGIPLAIVNGLGAIRYGYPAATQDIDVAVSRGDLDNFILAAPRYGFAIAWQAKSGWHTLLHGDVEINVVPEGGKARNTAPTTIPGPAQLGVPQWLDYASLPGWMELKLSAGRQKDRAHMVEVLKKTDADSVQAARDYISRIHQSYLQLFDELLEEAREERSQEEQRGGKDS